MERAHVLVRLGDGIEDGAAAAAARAPGICRTSATTVRLEHSDMSPGVASITFEHVFDAAEHSNSHIFRHGLSAGVDAALQGQAATLVLSGAAGAGKSFACHGSSQRNIPGIAALAIRHVFAQLQARHGESERRVLLACLFVDDAGELRDGIGPPDATEAQEPTWRSGVASWLLEQSVRVGSSAEAERLYSQARQHSGERDFVLALHVEVQTDDGRLSRGRFLCIDVHGDCIVEPGGARDSPEAESPSKVQHLQAPYFEDTHFPVNHTLSEAFGSFLGNENATYIMVAIRKATQYQQQAIQALLFACKAKDIRSACRISYLSEFTATTKGTRSSKSSAASSNNARDQDQVAEDRRPFDSPEEAATLTANSPSQETQSNRRSLTPRSPATPSIHTDPPGGSLSPSSSPRALAAMAPAATDHADLLVQKRLAVSDRLRKAYEAAKAATSGRGPPSSGGIATAKAAMLTREELAQDGNETDSSEHRVMPSRTHALHQLADTILEASEWRPTALPTADMSLLQKLELIRLKHEELERALSHEVTVKGKCVDRISKLTQTMGLQVSEHEKQLADALASKQVAEMKLRDMEAKFSGVAGEITSLQQQVAAMKRAASFAMTATTPTIASDPSNPSRSEAIAIVPTAAATCRCKLEERSMLQGFATKLEAAMQDAKSVVDFKDGVIRDLEARMRENERQSAESSGRLEREKLLLSSENARLTESIKQLRAELQANDERAREESFRTQQDQADLMVKMAQLTLDVETQRKQWSKREQELEARLATAAANERRASDALDQLREKHARVDEDLAVTRRKYVGLQAARTGAVATSERLEAALKSRHHEAEMQALVRKLTKRKAKLDRARALLADRKQLIAQTSARVEQLSQQLEAAAKARQDAQREATSLKRQLSAKASEVEGLGSMKRLLEDAVETLKEQLSDQQDDQEQLAEAERVMEEAAQRATVDALEEQKRELTRAFEQRAYELEQAFGRRVVAREAQLQKEHDARLRELMERHSAEVIGLQHGALPTRRSSSTATLTASQDESADTSGQRNERRRRRVESLERQLSTTRTASLSSSASSSRSSSSGASRSTPSPSSPLPSPSPAKKTTASAPTTPQQQSIRDLDALIVEKERRYDHHASNPRRTPGRARGGSRPSPAKSEGGDEARQYKKALAKKQREVDELQRRTQQLLNALATANEEETEAKARADQVARAQEHAAAKLDALQQELNRVKQENWSLSLALHVTERARP